MDYRPVPDAHADAFDEVLAYAFAPERGPNPDRDGPERPESFHPRALYDATASGDGNGDDTPAAEDIAAACGYHAFSGRIRGDFRDVAGVSAVASPPETRRQGLVRELLTELHREVRDDGIAFAALWPFEFPFYRRLGYARVGDYSRITVAPDALEDACPAPDGSYERLDADDWRRLDDVYVDWASDAFGLDRAEDWWRHRVFESWDTDPFVYGWGPDDADGELGGYLVYTVENPDDEEGKTMDVGELAYRDREARGHLLRFCRNHDSQVASVRIRGPADHRLFDELADPRAAETEVRPGPMARLVDVAAALERIAYPPAAEGTAVLDVRDDTCSWNDRRFRLTVGDGRGRVAVVDEDVDAAVSLDVGALARLVVGSHAVERLVELGEVTVADQTAARTLSAAFPRTDPYLREGF